MRGKGAGVGSTCIAVEPLLGSSCLVTPPLAGSSLSLVLAGGSEATEGGAGGGGGGGGGWSAYWNEPPLLWVPTLYTNEHPLPIL